MKNQQRQRSISILKPPSMQQIMDSNEHQVTEENKTFFPIVVRKYRDQSLYFYLLPS